MLVYVWVDKSSKELFLFCISYIYLYYKDSDVNNFFINNIAMKKFLLLFSLCACVNINQDNYTPITYLEFSTFMVGLNEVEHRQALTKLLNVDPVETPWCAAYVNAILREQNIPGSESVHEHPLLARSFLKWGTEVTEPKLGDVVVFSRGTSNWQGHVGFYIETRIVDGIEYYLILGGNQSNMVSYQLYSTDRLLGIRRLAD